MMKRLSETNKLKGKRVKKRGKEREKHKEEMVVFQDNNFVGV